MAQVVAHQMIRVFRGFEFWTINRVVFPNQTGWHYSSSYYNCLSGNSHGFFPHKDLQLPDGTPDDVVAEIDRKIANSEWITI